MEHSPEYPLNHLPSTESALQQPGRSAAIVYQSLTIAAMILLLGTLWVF
jgi:hypothetical protein